MLGRKTKSVSSSGSREGNVCNVGVARHRFAWACWQDLCSLAGLRAGKGGTKLSHGPGHAVPGNA